MEIVANSGKSLSALLADVPKTVVTPEIRLDTPDGVKFDIVREVTNHFRARYEVNDIDGVRIHFPQGWGLVRASNTQPALVMRFEASSPELLRQYQAEVERAVADAKAAAA
jgi:phosphomannomutase/phosphoglucomutase